MNIEYYIPSHATLKMVLNPEPAQKHALLRPETAGMVRANEKGSLLAL
jgi:hypothetical protein